MNPLQQQSSSQAALLAIFESDHKKYMHACKTELQKSEKETRQRLNIRDRTNQGRGRAKVLETMQQQMQTLRGENKLLLLQASRLFSQIAKNEGELRAKEAHEQDLIALQTQKELQQEEKQQRALEHARDIQRLKYQYAEHRFLNIQPIVF